MRRTFIDDLAEAELLDAMSPEDTVDILAAAAAEGSNPRTCRECGCTDVRGCPGGCHWVGPDLCSECA
jgi:hypothetical protein